MGGLFGPDILFRLIAIVVGLTVHEFGHAAMAYLVGDDTARRQGRLSLNPMRHLDPLGLLLIFVASFGWARPVVFDPRNIRINPRVGMILIAVAGVIMNVIVGLIGIWILSLVAHAQAFAVTGVGTFVLTAMSYIVMINISLAVFNLIPIPPLDGWMIIRPLLPRRMMWKVQSFERYGQFILLLLLITPFGRAIISTAVLSVFSWFGLTM